MFKRLLFIVAFYACCCHSFGNNRKVLFAIIDGIPADCIERLQPPTMMEIARNGSFCHSFAGGETGTYSETPTISAIGYTNILTGTWMNKHQVKGNSDIHANYHYATIFRLARDCRPELKTAIYSSWTDNRTVLLGEGLEATRNLSIDYVYDGYDLDTVRFPHQKGDVQIQAIDGQICKDASHCIAQNGPDLNWLYLWYTDDAFHNNGNGVVADSSVMTVDRQLRDVWQSIKMREKKFGEEWLVIITTDHGRTYSGYGHGGQSARERDSWIITNLPPKTLNAHFRPSLLSQVDICPTICRYLGLKLPAEQWLEIDGQPYIGAIDIDSLTVMPYDDKLDLTWTCYNKSARARILISPSNKFFEGGHDEWIEVTTVPASQGKCRIDLSTLPQSKFYKVSVETPNSHIGKWVYR